MIFRKPNRDVYKTALWRSIEPIDRVHILLVAEGAKPAAYCGLPDIKGLKEYLEEELKIFIAEPRGRISFEPGDEEILLPTKAFTVYKSKKLYEIYERVFEDRKISYRDIEGKLLGYPPCCREEYLNPTVNAKFNPYLLKLIRGKLYSFKIECIQRFLEGQDIPEVFLYLMPAQTPHSLNCAKSIKLLSKWKEIINLFDPAAGKALVGFNVRHYETYKEIAQKLKKLGVTPDQFKIGYLFVKK